ncbi:hypothetical protein BJY04DRAFT_160383 [Aspergillus karnatakaensis]|uniref:uncharacterized protein n=1 Tax=Aspergillus karnatakaensis TaxID=1810916 RepID=UPI003CCD56A6
MFAAVVPMQQSYDHSRQPWTPARPSPLSPRRQSSSPATTLVTTPIQQPLFAQSPSNLFTFSPSTLSSPSRVESASTSAPSRTRTSNFSPSATSPTYATRYKTNISNPLLAHSTKRTFNASTSPSARAVRRSAFLNRVKQDRDTGRVEARAEQLAFLENVAEQKEWAEGMKRRADEIQARFGLGIDEEEYLDNATEAEIEALDDYLEQEHALEMQLLEEAETGVYAPGGHEPDAGLHKPTNTNSSFSDDEYDDIFMDIADYSQPLDTDMDMS